MSRCVDWHKDDPFWGLECMGFKYRGVLLPTSPKLPQYRITNYVRTVRDRKVIPSANSTKLRMANQTKAMPLTFILTFDLLFKVIVHGKYVK